MRKNILIGAFAAVLGIGMVGCTPQARQDYDAAGDQIGRAADKTGEAIKTDADKTGEAIEQGAKNAGEAVENAAEGTVEAAKNAGKEIGEEADNAQTTLAVKNAILSADNLNAQDLNVDTEEKTVYLRGTVPTAANKARAESIAKNLVGTKYTIKNELKVSGQ
ncbi:MAG: BON domain-containing protein [Fimbriimonas sp.]